MESYIMSLEEYGIDRYKVVSLFQPGPTGPQGPAGGSYDGTGQIVVEERINMTSTTPFISQDILAHTISPGEIDRYNETILAMHSIYGTGAAFPITGVTLRWQRLGGAIDVELDTAATGNPVNGVGLIEIQADPLSNNHMYVSASLGSLWAGNSRISIGENWINKGGQIVVRASLAAGCTASFEGVYMVRRTSLTS
jgi:hypothetical protein